MTMHSYILAWTSPWTEEPNRLQSMRSQRVRHDWVDHHSHPLRPSAQVYGLTRIQGYMDLGGFSSLSWVDMWRGFQDLLWLSRRRQWQATPVLLPRKSHGWRSLVSCSPRGRYELDATGWLHFHFSLSRNGEGNGNPLQCSCLENPRDSRAGWAAVYGVAQSRTRMKWLSSSMAISFPRSPS